MGISVILSKGFQIPLLAFWKANKENKKANLAFKIPLKETEINNKELKNGS